MPHEGFKLPGKLVACASDTDTDKDPDYSPSKRSLADDADDCMSDTDILATKRLRIDTDDKRPNDSQSVRHNIFVLIILLLQICDE